MDIQSLVPVDFANQLVLTTEQVAEGLNCSIEQLRSNFKNHKDQFQEGVHFFKVEGGILRALKKRVNQVHAVSFGKGAKCLNLWTEQGVARHSKLIDTPQAWELFNKLEKHYFKSAPAEKLKAPLPTEPHDTRDNVPALLRAEKLIEVARLLEPSPQRQQILLLAANLLLDKNIF